MLPPDDGYRGEYRRDDIVPEESFRNRGNLPAKYPPDSSDRNRPSERDTFQRAEKNVQGGNINFSSRRSSDHPAFKSRDCKFFLGPAGCKRGDTCSFRHPDVDGPRNTS